MLGILPASANKYPQKCGEYGAITRLVLAEGEQLAVAMFSSNQNAIQIYVSRSGNFSIVETWPNYRSCIVRYGNGVRMFEPFAETA